LFTIFSPGKRNEIEGKMNAKSRPALVKAFVCPFLLLIPCVLESLYENRELDEADRMHRREKEKGGAARHHFFFFVPLCFPSVFRFTVL
jgi:hypothetical protein